jgi:hypothetical protein
MAAANVRRHGMGSPGPGPATLPRNLNDPTNVHAVMIHEAHLHPFFPVMGGQPKRKRGKELLMAFKRRMGVRVTNAGHDDFRHFCEIVSPFLRNASATISKQLRNSV